jgi:hypothetical protein
MYEKILKWYKQGLWTEIMVHNAFVKKVITEEQMNQILNKKED